MDLDMNLPVNVNPNLPVYEAELPTGLTTHPQASVPSL